MAITGIPAGGSGTFSETPVPSNGALQSGSTPVWTADDPKISLVPSPDGTTVVVTDTGTSATTFNLTVSGVSSNGSAISDTVPVPIIAAPPPPPATGFVIDQVS